VTFDGQAMFRAAAHDGEPGTRATFSARLDGASAQGQD